VIALYAESRMGLIRGDIDYQTYVTTAGVEKHRQASHRATNVRSRTPLTGTPEQKSKELNLGR